MKLICNICKLPLSSTLVDEKEGVTDLISLLKSHVKFKHKINFKSYEDHLADLALAFKNLPGLLFLQYFVDLENKDTSDRVGIVVDELQDGLAPIEDLFLDEEEDETKEEEELTEPVKTPIQE